MAMQKVYNRINWENYPSIETPINEQNLNKIDVATDELDNRVITHENVKATKEEVAPLIKEIGFNPKTGVFTITRKDGSSFTIDTLLEKIQTNWDYDPETQNLILTMEDGTTQEIDLSELITQFEFVDTDTIGFSVDSTGKVSAIVKEGSIQEKHLRPDYLADIKVESAKAEAARAAAELSEANAKKSENAAAKSASDSAGSASDSADSASASAASAAAALASQNAAKASETAAKNSQTAAKTSETNAKASETAAKTSETNAGNSAKAASSSATAAATSAAESAESAENAATSETNAAKSASAAATSEKNAKTSENNATTQATAAKNSATSAATSASTATTKAGEAATSASNAASSADTATRQATSASSSASTATTQANAAKTSATDAAASATKAQSYAEGGTGTRMGEDTDNAKYYYQQSKSISESFAGALRPMGTVTFAKLPALTSAVEGDMYNISDGFTTTAQFKEGAGHPYPAGTNVYKTADGYWDCLAGTPVTGVKGSAESSYRRGNVSLSAENVGALPITGGIVTGDTTFNKYLKINAWPGYGTGSADLWYNANTKTIDADGTVQNIDLNATTATTANKVANALKFTGGSTVTYDGSTAQTVPIPTTLPANGGTADTISTTLPILKGGTGATTANGAANNILIGTDPGTNPLNGWSLTDVDRMVFEGSNSGAVNSKFYRTPMTKVFDYLNAKTFDNAKNADTVDGKHAADLQNYNNLTNRPTIPAAANNGTLTIQRNGSTVATFTANSSENVTANIQDTDTNTDVNVTQTLTTANANYPLLLSSTTTTGTRGALFDSGVTLNPSTNVIAASVSGSAGSVAWANVSGRPTIPTVVNVLTSTSTTDALSAAQGKALNDRISSTAADLGTNINSLSVNKLDKTGKAASATTADSATTATKWNGYTLWFGTEDQYNAIATKDSKTIYFRS